MSEEPKVLDCPFCGGQATAYEYSGRHGVRCDGECPRIGYRQIPRVTGCSTQNEAIAIWNTRGHSAPSCRAAENDSLRAEIAILATAKRELAEHTLDPTDPCQCEWCDAMRYILSTAEIVRCAEEQERAQSAMVTAATTGIGLAAVEIMDHAAACRALEAAVRARDAGG